MLLCYPVKPTKSSPESPIIMRKMLNLASFTLAAAGTFLAASCTVTPGGSISEDIEYSKSGTDRKAALEIVAPKSVQEKTLESRGTSIGPLSQVQVRLGNDVIKAAKGESQAYYQTVTVVEEATNTKNVDRVTFKDLDGDLSKTDLSLKFDTLVQFTKAGANTTEKKFEVKGAGDGGDIFRGAGTSADTVLGKAREEALQEFVKQYGAQLATMKGASSDSGAPTSGASKGQRAVSGDDTRRVAPGLQKAKNPNHANGRERKSY